MKKLIAWGVLLSLLLTLAGCREAESTDKPTAPTKNEEQETITALETELQKCREELYVMQTKHEAEILALQQQLAALGGGGNAEDPEGENAPVFRYRIEDGGAVITGYTGKASLLNIPDSLDDYPVTAIGERAFEGSSVVGVVLPQGVRSVGWFAFYGCAQLSHITLPPSVESIGHAVFDGCPALTVFCQKGSYAEAFAKSYGLAYFCN